MQAFLRHRQHALGAGAGAGAAGASSSSPRLAPSRPPTSVRSSSTAIVGGNLGRIPGRRAHHPVLRPQAPRSSRDGGASGARSAADGDEAPPRPAPSIEETLAGLAAEVQELRREVRELREARASGGVATVRGAAEGRRFLSTARDDRSGDEGEGGGPSSERGRALPAIGDDEAARMAATVALGRTGGLAVLEQSWAGGSSSEEDDDDEEEGMDDGDHNGASSFSSFAAADSSGSDSDDDLAAEALFEEDDRLVLPPRRRRRQPRPSSSPTAEQQRQQQQDRRAAAAAAAAPSAAAPPPPSAARVVSPTAEELAARWRDAERGRFRQRPPPAPEEDDDGLANDDDIENENENDNNVTRQRQRRPVVLAPAQQVSHGGGGARMTLDEYRALPESLFLVRHAESMGNTDMDTYANTPDYDVPLSVRGWEQAVAAGTDLRDLLERRHGAANYRIFCYVSPYARTRQTFVGIRQAFEDRCVAGLDEDINLREQEFSGGLQTDRIRKDLEERLRYGRFFYRFPQGESTADVYLRQCLFEDQLLRSLRSGRHGDASHVVIIGHGIALRVLLMRLLGWTVESFLQVHNPPNATPLEIEKISEASFLRLSSKLDRRSSLQVRQIYRLSGSARRALRLDMDLSSSTMDLLHQQFT